MSLSTYFPSSFNNVLLMMVVGQIACINKNFNKRIKQHGRRDKKREGKKGDGSDRHAHHRHDGRRGGDSAVRSGRTSAKDDDDGAARHSGHDRSRGRSGGRPGENGGRRHYHNHHHHHHRHGHRGEHHGHRGDHGEGRDDVRSTPPPSRSSNHHHRLDSPTGVDNNFLTRRQQQQPPRRTRSSSPGSSLTPVSSPPHRTKKSEGIERQPERNPRDGDDDGGGEGPSKPASPRPRYHHRRPHHHHRRGGTRGADQTAARRRGGGDNASVDSAESYPPMKSVSSDTARRRLEHEFLENMSLSQSAEYLRRQSRRPIQGGGGTGNDRLRLTPHGKSHHYGTITLPAAEHRNEYHSLDGDAFPAEPYYVRRRRPATSRARLNSKMSSSSSWDSSASDYEGNRLHAGFNSKVASDLSSPSTSSSSSWQSSSRMDSSSRAFDDHYGSSTKHHEPTKEEVDLRECRKQFHARPMPDFNKIHERLRLNSPRGRAATMSAAQRRSNGGGQSASGAPAAAGHFHARPLPAFYDRYRNRRRVSMPPIGGYPELNH